MTLSCTNYPPSMAAQDRPTAPPAPITINVGTRRSALALKQAELVVSALQSAYPGITFAVHGMATAGDRDKTTPLPNLGKGLWTSELEAKLTAGEFDLVVHSLKDMPTTLPAGCALGGVTAREDPRDVVVFRGSSDVQGESKRPRVLADLPPGSVVGTSSVRRAAQLRHRYSGLAFRDIRGNIDTRLKKLDAADSPYDCIVLAAAGLLRMGLGGRIAQYLEWATAGGGHAVGQGAMGIEVREGDERVLSLLRSIEDRPTTLACVAERSVMRALEGGCSVPVGVETSWEGNGKLRLRATVVSLDGQEAVDGDEVGEVSTLEEADGFGKRVARGLVDKGAQKILDVINANRVTTAPVVKEEQ